MYIRRIKLEKAEPGMRLAESVYVAAGVGSGEMSMLAANENAELDEKIIALLSRRKVQTIIVFSETPPVGEEIVVRPNEPQEPPKPRPPQKRVVLPPSSAKGLPPEEIAPIKAIIDEKLKKEAVNSVRQLFTCLGTGEGTVNKTTAYQVVSGIEGVVNDLIDVISTDPTGLVHIDGLKHYDDYTYHHSLSVAMLCVATGQALGLGSDELFRLGRAAMMHDIGKQSIPIEIINKKSDLTDTEFEAIKKHAIMGAISLKNNEIGDIELWNAVMYHHEKVNGTGYPKGLRAEDIPMFSKIISIADVYDALTSYRAYRAPLLPSEAFEIIRKGIGVSYEYKIANAFFSKLELYPLNTIVELSDSRLGIVVDTDNVFRMRPIIRIWGSTEIVYLAAPMNRKIEIVGVMNPADLPNG